MKKIFSFLVALILVSSSFGVVFAQETQARSVDEIKTEIEKVRQELEKETQKRGISTRSAEKLNTEEIMQKESATLPLKNKLADLQYDLAIAEGNVISLFDIQKSLQQSTYQARSYGFEYNGHFFQPGDVIVFYRPKRFMDGFSWVSHWYTHAIMVMDSQYGINTAPGQRSYLKPLSEIFSSSYLEPYTKVMLKRFDNDILQSAVILDFSKNNLLNKLYPSIFNILTTAHSKESLFEMYCSQIPWLAYTAVRGIDIDNDKWPVVFPVDILNSYYWTSYVLK